MSKGHKESKQLLIRDLGKLKSESQGKSICVRYKITNRDLSLPPTISHYFHSFGRSGLWGEKNFIRRGQFFLMVLFVRTKKS